MRSVTPYRALVPVVVATLCLASCAGDPIERITEDDLRADLFALAGDQTRGREGGTLDELAASMWLAERAREAGLEPAGDDGTFFQFFPLERFRVSAGSRVVLGGTTLQMGRDVIPGNTVLAEVNAPVVLAPSASPDALAGLNVRDRALVVRYAPQPDAEGALPSLRAWARGGQRATASSAVAAIVVLVPDDQADQWARVAFRFPRGSYALDPDGSAEPRTAPDGVPTLYVREAALSRPLGSGDTLEASSVSPEPSGRLSAASRT